MVGKGPGRVSKVSDGDDATLVHVPDMGPATEVVVVPRAIYDAEVLVPAESAILRALEVRRWCRAPASVHLRDLADAHDGLLAHAEDGNDDIVAVVTALGAGAQCGHVRQAFGHRLRRERAAAAPDAAGAARSDRASIHDAHLRQGLRPRRHNAENPPHLPHKPWMLTTTRTPPDSCDPHSDSGSCDSPGSLVEFVVGDEEEEEVEAQDEEDDEAVPEFPYEQDVLAEHTWERSGPRRSLRSRKAPERYIDTIQDSIARLYLDDVPESERDVALHHAVEGGEEDGGEDSEYAEGEEDDDDTEEEEEEEEDDDDARPRPRKSPRTTEKAAAWEARRRSSAISRS